MDDGKSISDLIGYMTAIYLYKEKGHQKAALIIGSSREISHLNLRSRWGPQTLYREAMAQYWDPNLGICDIAHQLP